MSDTPGTPATETPSTPPPPPSAGGPSGKELEEGKLFAILSYALNIIGLPFWLVPVIQKNNEFALYHAKQAMFMWLAVFAVYVVGFVAMFVLVAVFAPLACIAQIAIGVIGIGALILNILGLINAVNAKQAPVPVVGEMALNMFKGMTAKA